MKNLKQSIILISFFFIQIIYATNLDVNINIPSGNYNNVLKIELTPTDSKAKTFFSFNPNGTPNDAFLYTGAIIIKKSTPIIYWSFIDTKTESKIKQNDYILNFPNTIILNPEIIYENGEIKNLKILNTDSKEINISFWEIKKEEDIYIIPDNTIIEANSDFIIPKNFTGTGYISLFSPNGEKKDFIEIIKKDVKEIQQIKIIENKKDNKVKNIILDKESENNIIDTNIVNNNITETDIIKTDINKTETTNTDILNNDTKNEIVLDNNLTKGTILTVDNEIKENIKPNITNNNLIDSNNLGQNLKISSKENLNFIKNDKLILTLILVMILIIGAGFRLYIFYFKK